MSEQASWPIAGTGAVASIGRSPAEIFDALCRGTSGLHPMRGFDRSYYAGHRLYEIDDRDADDVPGRATAFLLEAITQALAEAGLDEPLGDIPVVVGTGLRELRSVELWARGNVLLSAGQLHFGTALRERFGATMTHTVSNACSASLYALAMGCDLLAAGAETVVVAGVDAITESMVGIADRLQSVAPDTVRPFDRKRMGTILGEGASAVVLRRSEVPGRPGPGWVCGVAVNCDAHHTTAPDAGSIAAAIRDAHQRAGIGPEDVGLVMLHGTGTHANDAAEARALRAVFGPAPEKTLMTAMKSMTGHTSGASGLHSLIVALRAMRNGLVPPTLGLDEPIEEAEEFRIVRHAAAPADLALAQINAFGFGGINAVAVVAGRR
ncbi:beta-ketoacyl synthase N-terminal-like domain-containing protein [Streptomyces xinghaiensis]|uniref:beta-ketoacyl synthase N-terminal-like domain-containing protein n=1 Tax=Streptomyces xinghaiensis TaxID=1038928 RepID=UPI002E0F11E6|nr:3-oxoacyl-ACP synthase [Streptomyces xinghaiensis]